MPALAITGSIGSGKSLALRALAFLLKDHLGADIYSADEENRRLLDEDPEVKSLICSQLGTSCYHSDGRADRKILFDLISHDQSARTTLESILHPRLEACWKPLAEKFRQTNKAYFLAEIPLLYEKRLEVFFDKTIVVGCSDSVRRERLQRLRSLTAVQATAWLNIQVSQEAKVGKAHHLLWNDGSEALLQQQIHLLASYFLQS